MRKKNAKKKKVVSASKNYCKKNSFVRRNLKWGEEKGPPLTVGEHKRKKNGKKEYEKIYKNWNQYIEIPNRYPNSIWHEMNNQIP